MTIEEALRSARFRAALQSQYRDGVGRAERGYTAHAADEDAVTGGLGESLRNAGAAKLDDGTVVTWITTYTKLRGRGPDAPERRLGGDGVFEIELTDPDGLRTRKSLMFQAKNRSRKRLQEQASQIAQLPGGGLVVSYSPDGYRAEDAATVADQQPGNSKAVPLAEALAGDFLECRRGSSSYSYDANREVVVIAHEGMLVEIRRFEVRHRVRTRVRAR